MNFILSKAKQLLASLKTQELETAPAVKRTPVSPQQKDKSKQAEIVELRKRNIWSGKECALLIVALEDIYFGKKERADVIAKLSSKLRSMGRINGANVGDLYRNEAGIALQMLKMEFLLTEGKKGLSGASKAFERIYELYKTDIDAFNKEFGLESNGLFRPKKTERVENKSKKPVVVVIKKRKMLSTQNNMADNENNKVNDPRTSSEAQNTDSEEKWKALDGIIANYLTTPEPEIKSEEPIKEEQGYAVELGKILSSMSDDLDDFYNKFHLGGKKQYIITRRMMSAQPESLVSIAHHFNVLESEIADIEKSLYSRIKGILEAYKEKIKNLFEQYKHSLECNKTGHFGWGKYYVLLNNLSSFTEFFVDINSNKIIKVQKLGAINPVVARGDASSKLEEQQELREKAPSDQLSITGSKAVAFDVGQYFEEVHGWSSLYSSVFNLMIKKYKQLKPYPDTIVVSCTEGTKKGHYVKLINGLLLNVNYSAVAVMQRIRELLDCYGMTPDQCSIYLENNQGKTIKIKLSNGSNEPSFNVFEAADTQKSDATDRYSDLSQKIYTVLCEKYQKGFRLDSHLEKERFKLFFEQIHSEKIPEEISEKLLDQLILKNGIVYNDRVYIAENMLDENTKEDLFAFINQSFENGHNTIYYTALFEEFSDKFLTQSIFDPDILREYLKYQNTGKYYVFKEYLSKDKSVNQSISDEIIQLLVDRSEPFFQDELSAMLPHIDKNKLIKELRSSSEFISNGKEQYFLARNFNITNDETETVKKLISDLLDASSTHFITAAEVMEIIHKKVPEIFENNGFISELGVRNALASILGDSFSFNSNVISCKDTNLNLNDIFEDFAKNTSSFSLAELKNLASEFSAPIYFDAINKYAIRISKDEFIGKDKIDFNFKEIDHAISLFCQAGYTPIQAVNTFASFPDVGYKWNTFLLESYLQNYSPAFRVFQASACETKSVGAIVKKTSAYTSFDDILVDAVAKSRCQLQKDTILQFLCDYGYIARRTYSSIDNIIERASQKRNSKG